MKKKFLMFAALVAVISLAFVFTGCGGGTDDDEDDPFRFYTRTPVTFVPSGNEGRMEQFNGSGENRPPRYIQNVTHVALTFSSEPATLYFNFFAQYSRPGFDLYGAANAAERPVFWFGAFVWDPRQAEEWGQNNLPELTIWNAATNTLYVNLDVWNRSSPDPVRTAIDAPHTGTHLTHIRNAGFLNYIIQPSRANPDGTSGGAVPFTELGLTSAVLLTPP